ncbi:unnamed protein product [Nippostrongylus brasiliensis]|uniref:Uncharacterized protein n=1 Tax=Nippostrongylus brasiliensis TaxID=27835 RepID=A0A0N4Y9L0_NIPBR|nr:unnamed protein product [Nippostrongylus brasiliensis]
MPPSMQKSDITSVRERVLAIERSQQQLSDNSIIRARYVPDVRGVNRYKHFHIVTSPVKQNGPEKLATKNSNDLPQLRPTRIRQTRQIIATAADSPSDDNGVEKGRRNKKTVLPQLGPQSVTLTKVQKEKDICDYTASEIGNGFVGFAFVVDDNKIDPIRTDTEPKKSPLPRMSARIVRETATQTLVDVKLPENRGESCGEGRSTQTDSYPIVVAPPRRRKSEIPVNMEDIEEREALYQVIEDALGETIDRYSRLRTNQIIANSARKQGQIWRDAKEFIANQLVPQSIQLANKSRSRSKTAAEIVASIKVYP